jgi:LCP family protein required for cell wall assembly
MNVLLVGSDSSAGLDPNDPVQKNRSGEHNGDVIIIAHLDERTDSASLLSIPRDVWGPIAGTHSESKINAAFSVGGAETLIDTIEERFGIPIHHYVQVDFAGFRSLVEAVGSVPVWFAAPARDFNPVEGVSQTGFRTDAGCIELGPEQALSYVRSRYYQTQGADGRWKIDPEGDLGRIARQQDFLRRLLTRAVDRGARNPFTLRRLIDVALDRVTIDQELTPNNLLDLGRRFSSFDPDELGTYTIPVEFGAVGSASVLFAQEEPLQPLLALFRGAPIADPSTIRVLVQHDGVARSDLDRLTQELTAAGYPKAAPTRAEDAIPAGTVVRYAAGTAEAARGVAAALGGVPLALDDTLDGRDVVVSVSTTPAGPASTTAPSTGSTTAAPTTAPGPATTESSTTVAPDPALACR